MATEILLLVQQFKVKTSTMWVLFKGRTLVIMIITWSEGMYSVIFVIFANCHIYTIIFPNCPTVNNVEFCNGGPLWSASNQLIHGRVYKRNYRPIDNWLDSKCIIIKLRHPGVCGPVLIQNLRLYQKWSNNLPISGWTKYTRVHVAVYILCWMGWLKQM